MKIPELLLPAGDLEKLKTALLYGGDAYYVGGEVFSLRKASKNFKIPELKKAIKIVHEKNKKIYLTLNIFPRVYQFKELKYYLNKIKHLDLDALIISDLGVLELIKELKIDFPLHISTQANILNHYAIKFLKRFNIKRIILARELTSEEIVYIRKKIKNIELEIFVHGAMCMSYSGRCFLSLYFNNRDANQGDCSQPCRWKYYLYEENRPGIFLPVEQEENMGSFIFNSKDLCLLPYLDKVVEIGVDSIKIEGRVKGEYYIAVIGRLYREALEMIKKNPKKFKFKSEWEKELDGISHRSFTTGFFFGPDKDLMKQDSDYHPQKYRVVGKIIGRSIKGYKVITKNNFSIGDIIEIFSPTGTYNEKIKKIYHKNKTIKTATNPKKVIVPLDGNYEYGSYLRKLYA